MTFTVKTPQGTVLYRIVCDTKEAFEEIRKQYFPGIPPKAWKQEKTNGAQ